VEVHPGLCKKKIIGEFRMTHRRRKDRRDKVWREGVDEPPGRPGCCLGREENQGRGVIVSIVSLWERLSKSRSLKKI